MKYPVRPKVTIVTQNCVCVLKIYNACRLQQHTKSHKCLETIMLLAKRNKYIHANLCIYRWYWLLINVSSLQMIFYCFRTSTNKIRKYDRHFRTTHSHKCEYTKISAITESDAESRTKSGKKLRTSVYAEKFNRAYRCSAKSAKWFTKWYSQYLVRLINGYKFI